MWQTISIGGYDEVALYVDLSGERFFRILQRLVLWQATTHWGFVTLGKDMGSLLKKHMGHAFFWTQRVIDVALHAVLGLQVIVLEKIFAQ